MQPYIALDFDQNVIVNGRMTSISTMGQLKSITHLSSYGRPLCAVLVYYREGSLFEIRWRSHLMADERLDIIDLAACKLTNGTLFNPAEQDHVFAILSHRICIDPILASSEAVALADRSVACHMRILTGISPNGQTFYTYSPSEALLTLGAIHEIYKTKNTGLWSGILETFSRHLCSAGLVEKGLLGELASRVLFIIARDFSAPCNINGRGRNLLEPVPFYLSLTNSLATPLGAPLPSKLHSSLHSVIPMSIIRTSL
jgi:hypothetical protein